MALVFVCCLGVSLSQMLFVKYLCVLSRYHSPVDEEVLIILSGWDVHGSEFKKDSCTNW